MKEDEIQPNIIEEYDRGYSPKMQTIPIEDVPEVALSKFPNETHLFYFWDYESSKNNKNKE